MSNPNYLGVSNEILLQKLRDNHTYVNEFPSSELPAGAAADYFFDDVWRECEALRAELKSRGINVDFYGTLENEEGFLGEK